MFAIYCYIVLSNSGIFLQSNALSFALLECNSTIKTRKNKVENRMYAYISYEINTGIYISLSFQINTQILLWTVLILHILLYINLFWSYWRILNNLKYIGRGILITYFGS